MAELDNSGFIYMKAYSEEIWYGPYRSYSKWERRFLAFKTLEELAKDEDREDQEVYTVMKANSNEVRSLVQYARDKRRDEAVREAAEKLREAEEYTLKKNRELYERLKLQFGE